MTIKTFSAVVRSQIAFPLVCGVALVLGTGGEARAATPLAESHLRYAIDLGGRGAVYSAQSEFTQVLQIVAQSLDSQAPNSEKGAQEHAAALSAGLCAFAEADDFNSGAAPRDGGVDFSRRVAMHRTPVLKKADANRLSPVAAMQAYYDFGKQQMALAAGHDRAASAALCGLAKLQAVIGGRNPAPKAVAMHQAALLVNPDNYLSANELGVLLFRCGQADDARGVLIHSVRIAPRSETWHNLAVVCEELGRAEESQNAKKQCELALAAERTAAAQGASSQAVYWVDKDKLTSMPAEAAWDAPMNGASGAKSASLSAPEANKKSERSFGSLLPWSTKEATK